MAAGEKGRLPKLIAFDLDGTLWDPEMYELRGGTPFRRHKSKPAVAVSSAGEEVHLMGPSEAILRELATAPDWKGVQIAYVSRTEYPEYAFPCMQTITVAPGLSMADVGHHAEIYPGRKTTHFKAIAARSGIPFRDMLFFDNERRNCTECAPLGITCIYTPSGMTQEMWDKGLATFAAQQDAAVTSRQ